MDRLFELSRIEIREKENKHTNGLKGVGVLEAAAAKLNSIGG